MRIAAQVLLAYLLLVVVGALWRHLPTGRAAPDLVALSAVYLGLGARQRLWPAMLGAVVMGYLGDLLMGSPRGMMATIAGVLCLVGHLVSGRLLVRGWLFSAVFASIVGLVSGVTTLLLMRTTDVAGGSVAADLEGLVATVALTGLCGPLVFKLCRMVDARFARTQRERDAALEGLIP